MSKAERSAWYILYDCEPAIAIVRCPLGDVDEFQRRAAEAVRYIGEDPDQYPIGAPIWRRYRHNPCTDGEHGWDLGRADGPGPGNWTGAFVVPADEADELERTERLTGHEALAVSDVL
jgi:hypothetical protein